MIKRCVYCLNKFQATSGVAKFCSDSCHLLGSIDRGDCWVWNAGLDKDRYGVVKLRGGRRLKAHRAAYMEFIGPIPDGMMVCHECDNPACIKPKHLFLGSALDNKTDCVAKARHVHGEAVYWKRKLTEADVLAIIADERSAPILAAEYGITKENVYAIRKRKIWKHLLDASHLDPGSDPVPVWRYQQQGRR